MNSPDDSSKPLVNRTIEENKFNDVDKVIVSEKKPSDINVIRKPSDITVIRKPSDITVLKKPSDINVIRKPSGIDVIRKPSGIDVIRKPSDVITAIRKVTTDLKDIAKSLQVNSEPEDIPLEEASIHLLTEAFRYSHGITEDEADELLLKFGKNELPEKVIPKWYIFVSQV